VNPIRLLPSLLVLTFSLNVAGCSSSAAKSTPGPDGGTPSTTCTVTLSGGVASSHDCLVTLAFDGTGNATDFFLSTTNIDPATEPNLTASIQISGSPRTGAFLATDANLLQGLLAVGASDSSDAWSADAASANTALTGSFTLMLGDLGSPRTAGNSRDYANPHGTLDAVLVPVTAGQTSASVAAHAAF